MSLMLNVVPAEHSSSGLDLEFCNQDCSKSIVSNSKHGLHKDIAEQNINLVA